MSSSRRAPGVIESFNYAFEGIIHVLRTQRNLRIHFAIAVAVIVFALIVNVTKLELIALLISITFVLISEMLNSAVEAAIDIATTSFDPMAKLAKDVAAGAVLIASTNAVAVGYLVFSGKVADRSADLLDRLRQAPAELTVVALVLTVIAVIASSSAISSIFETSTTSAATSTATATTKWMRRFRCVRRTWMIPSKA